MAESSEKKNSDYHPEGERLDDENDIDQLRGLIDRLETQMKKKEETLRTLRLTEWYHEKHNLTNLDQLHRTWYQASQSIATDLLKTISSSSAEGKKANMEEMLIHLGIDFDLIGYDRESDSFRDI